MAGLFGLDQVHGDFPRRLRRLPWRSLVLHVVTVDNLEL